MARTIGATESHPNVIVLIGGPRSGTTWLGKIFDSHPRVLYRHEPDATVPCVDFPFIVPPEHFDRHSEAARRYLLTLCATRSVRAVTLPPYFSKTLSSPLRQRVRRLMLAAGRLGTAVPLVGSRVQDLPIPDMLAAESADRPVYVIKSVVSLGRAGLYARALPDAPIVLIVRHPCGFVASHLRGHRSGKLPVRFPMHTLSESRQAHRHGLALDDFERMDPVSRYAWLWTLMNEKAMEELAGRSNATIARHDELSSAPEQESRRLFAFCGLEWDHQTEEFIRESSAHHGATSYYGLRRDSAAEAEKWRHELDATALDTVLSIARRSEAGRLFA